MQPIDEENGVFASQWIRNAIAGDIIRSTRPIDEGQIQPNSLDLRLDGVGYRVQCSFLPGAEGIQQKLGRYRWYEFELPYEGMVLERNQIYCFPLCESLQLPKRVSAHANPKSSTGRLDIFTRLVTEEGTSFDTVEAGYSGRLYLEVVPRSFAIRARAGDSLAQIRFQTGDPGLSREETIQLIDSDDIILGPELNTLRSDQIPVLSGVVLSVSLPRKNARTVGYHARKNTAPVDLRHVGGHRIRHYWDWIHADNKPIILEPDEFYIFASRELVRLPPAYCAEMVPFDPASGELRTHYAGFFDSGFGYSPTRPASQTAAAVVLEVRSRDVPFLIEDGQPLFRLNIMRNIGLPDILYGQQLGSNYQGQRLRLGKQFTQSGPDGDDEDTPPPAYQPKLDFSAS